MDIDSKLDRILDKLGEHSIILLAVFLLLFCTPLQAKVRELSLDLKRMPFQRDFMFPEQTAWGHEVKLTADVSLWRYFQDNQIIGRTYGDRFRYVSWEFDHGITIFPWLDLIHSHKSEHAMDIYVNKFPVRDSYGIRLHFKED